jgi:hypothetical protein
MRVITFLPGRVTLHTEPHHGLEQIIPLLLNLLDFHIILVCSLNQGHYLLFSLGGMPMGVRLPGSKLGHLLNSRGELDDLLASNNELHHQLHT